MADPARNVGSASNHSYPRYPNNIAAQSFDIAQDNASFTYDPQTGLLTEADNAFAQVHRDYYKNGLIKDEVLKIAHWTDTGPTTS